MSDHLPYHLDNYSKLHNLNLTDQPYLESQIASISDDIAYNNHDVEDAIRANLISLDDIAELSFFEKIIINLKDHYKDIPNKLLVYQVLRNSLCKVSLKSNLSVLMTYHVSCTSPIVMSKSRN